MIRIENLELSFGSQKVIRNISLSIPEGVLIGITGESGCGKTTLLKCIFGLYRKYTGTIEMPSGKTALIDQQCTLLETITNRENLLLTASETGEKKLNELSDYFEVSKCLDKYPSECSMGQRQKIAIIRALSSDPDFILADEPFAHLDFAGIKKVADVFDRLKQEGKTIIVSSHESALWKRADKVYRMRNGLIEIA